MDPRYLLPPSRQPSLVSLSTHSPAKKEEPTAGHFIIFGRSISANPHIATQRQRRRGASWGRVFTRSSERACLCRCPCVPVVWRNVGAGCVSVADLIYQQREGAGHKTRRGIRMDTLLHARRVKESCRVGMSGEHSLGLSVVSRWVSWYQTEHLSRRT